MTAQMIPVESSNIEAYGFDTKAKELHVRFKGGNVYAYPAVPVDVRKAFLAADSKGKFFHEHIRGKFDGRKLEAK